MNDEQKQRRRDYQKEYRKNITEVTPESWQLIMEHFGFAYLGTNCK